MEIKKGTKLNVRDSRKGKFQAIALRSFNTEDEWYPIAVAEGNGTVHGLSTDWEEGEEIPARKGITHIY